jgi:beta-galactosidase
MRLWTYQSVAHGADRVLYFRWRTATMGTEIYWHGINDYHNQPNRRCAEAAMVGREFASIGPQIAGSKYRATVAILRDYDNEWDGELDIWHGPFTRQSEAAWHQALQRLHVPVDVVTVSEKMTHGDLAKYQCVIYPHPAILPDHTAAQLSEYAYAGGTVIFGCRTGYKDVTGQCLMRPFGGPIAELCGIVVEDFTRIGARQKEPSLEWRSRVENHGRLTTGPFNDILRVTSDDVRVRAMYGQDAGYYAGKPALVERNVSTGKAIYYGGVFTTSVARSLALHLKLKSPVADIVTIPPDVEVAVRERSDGTRLIFLLNYADTLQPILAHTPAMDLITRSMIRDEFQLEPYGVAILQA